jgi:hypothetical protein
MLNNKGKSKGKEAEENSVSAVSPSAVETVKVHMSGQRFQFQSHTPTLRVFTTFLYTDIEHVQFEHKETYGTVSLKTVTGHEYTYNVTIDGLHLLEQNLVLRG